jgi:hypothetical protein
MPVNAVLCGGLGGLWGRCLGVFGGTKVMRVAQATYKDSFSDNTLEI